MDAVTNKLINILNNIDGANEGAFCGYDGLIVVSHKLIDSHLDIESLCANLVTIIVNLKKTIVKPKDVIITSNNHIIFSKILEDGFVCIIMNIDGNLGRAKLECSKLSQKFIE